MVYLIWKKIPLSYDIRQRINSSGFLRGVKMTTASNHNSLFCLWDVKWTSSTGEIGHSFYISIQIQLQVKEADVITGFSLCLETSVWCQAKPDEKAQHIVKKWKWKSFLTSDSLSKFSMYLLNYIHVYYIECKWNINV